MWKTESQIDQVKHRFRDKMGLDGDWHIVLYHGFASQRAVRVEGRVLQDRNIAVRQQDSYFTNVLNTYKRLGSREAPHAEVSVSVFGHSAELVTDDDGYFQVDIPHELEEVPIRSAASARLLSHEPYDREFVGSIFGAGPDSRLAVISDVDDTILVTGAVSLRQMARWTFLHNAYSRRRIAGVGAWYRAIQQGADRKQHHPVFYVSSSPWNFFDLIDHFIQLNRIPLGPLLLRDYGIDNRKLVIEPHGRHKTKRCEELFAAYPDHQFLLIGDAGQEDAFIYCDLIRNFPNRIKVAFIRAVNRNKQAETVRREIESARKEGLPIFYIQDSTEGAEICRELGIVNDDQVAEIRAAVAAHET